MPPQTGHGARGLHAERLPCAQVTALFRTGAGAVEQRILPGMYPMHLQVQNQLSRLLHGSHVVKYGVCCRANVLLGRHTRYSRALHVRFADERLSWKLRPADSRVPQARRSVRVFVVKAEEKTVVIGLAADSGELS